MNQSFHVEATLLSASCSHISKRTNLVSVVVSAVLSLLGVLFIYYSLDADESSSTLSMILLTLGTALILVSLYRLFWMGAEIVYIPTGSTISEGSYYVDTDDLETLQGLLERKSFDRAVSVIVKHTGNGRLDYMVSKDGKFAVAQLFHFVPYAYEPASDIYYYTDADAAAFKSYVETFKY